VERVSAQCVLRAPDGRSILDAPEGPGAETAERQMPAPEAFDEAAARLERLGFDVGDRGAATLTVSGDRALFERVFSTRLEWAEEPGTGGPSWRPERPPVVPDELADVVAGVVFPIVPISLP
jgi:hypothetical protein